MSNCNHLDQASTVDSTTIPHSEVKVIRTKERTIENKNSDLFSPDLLDQMKRTRSKWVTLDLDITSTIMLLTTQKTKD